MSYFLGHWQTGFVVACEWVLGLARFVLAVAGALWRLALWAGVMSLAVDGLATFFMVIEKLPQIGHYVTKPMGVILIAAGVGVCLAPIMGGYTMAIKKKPDADRLPVRSASTAYEQP